VSQTAQTWALVGATLGAVVITFLGTSFLQHLQARRDRRYRLAAGVAELLAAAQDVVVGVSTIRQAHQRRTKFRYYIRLLATFWHALPRLATSRDLLEYSALKPLVGSALELDREITASQRLVALDAATVLASRLNRYFAAVALLTLSEDMQIADAVRKLTPKVTALAENVAAKQRKFDRLTKDMQHAMEHFRAVADRRLGNRS
jgi:hypothetical protein